MSREPGKKFKVHHFDVEGMRIPVEIRITDRNRFYAKVEDDRFEYDTFDELRDAVKPRLELIHKLVYDPVIQVDYVDDEDRARTHYGSRQDWVRQEVELSFSPYWVSRVPISTEEDHWVFHRMVKAEVDAETGEIEPINKERARHYSDRVGKDGLAALVPFTPERWRKLVAIAVALADVRERLASVLAKGGARLDALQPSNLLAALPDDKTRRRP